MDVTVLMDFDGMAWLGLNKRQWNGWHVRYGMGWKIESGWFDMLGIHGVQWTGGRG